MATTSDIAIRHYDPADYPLLESWWEAHGAEPLHESMVPSSTCIVEMGGWPVASGSIFGCNCNHVAFLHGLVTRPGLSIGKAGEALRALMDGIDMMMRASGHTLLLGTVQPGGLARGSRMMGFAFAGDLVQPVARVVKPQSIEDHGS